MFTKITNLLSGIMNYFDRYRLIKDRLDNKPYLERYYLFLKERKNFPFNIFLHKFLKSDSEDLHDHPWNYRSFVLWGGYWEHTLQGKKWRGPMSYQFYDAYNLHRIELDPSYSNCWTLFIPGQRIRDWGFMTNDGWISHQEYYNQNN